MLVSLFQWPFVRVLCMQEVASVTFSIFNFIVQLNEWRKFRKEVNPDYPFYWMWSFYVMVSFYLKLFVTLMIVNVLFCKLSCLFTRFAWILGYGPLSSMLETLHSQKSWTMCPPSLLSLTFCFVLEQGILKWFEFYVSYFLEWDMTSP